MKRCTPGSFLTKVLRKSFLPGRSSEIYFVSKLSLLFSRGKMQLHVPPCLRPRVRVLPASDDRDLICWSCPHALPGRSSKHNAPELLRASNTAAKILEYINMDRTTVANT